MYPPSPSVPPSVLPVKWGICISAGSNLWPGDRKQHGDLPLWGSYTTHRRSPCPTQPDCVSVPTVKPAVIAVVPHLSRSSSMADPAGACTGGGARERSARPVALPKSTSGSVPLQIHPPQLRLRPRPLLSVLADRRRGERAPGVDDAAVTRRPRAHPGRRPSGDIRNGSSPIVDGRTKPTRRRWSVAVDADCKPS